MAYLSMGEAHRRITDYLNRFSDAVSSQDGASLSLLLSLSSNSPSLLSLADALNLFQDTSRVIKQSDKYSQYTEIFIHLFRSLQTYRLGNLADAYQAFEKSANAFIQEFRNWESASAWALEALYVVAYEITQPLLVLFFIPNPSHQSLNHTEQNQTTKMHRSYSIRQSRAPTASQIQNPPPPSSSTKSGRWLGKGHLTHSFRRSVHAGAFGPDLARKLSQLVKMEKNLMRSMELVGRERMEAAQQLSVWGEACDDDVSDVTDKLGVLLYEIGELEDQYVDRYDQYRTTLKSIRNIEASVQPSRDRKQKITDQIAHLKYKEPNSPKIVVLEQELVRAEAESLVAEAQLSNITREKLKAAFTYQFDAMKEHCEKLAIIAGFGKHLLELVDDTPVTPGETRNAYDGYEASKGIIQDCEDALTNWVHQNAVVKSSLSTRTRNLSQRRKNRAQLDNEGHVDLSGQDAPLNDRESGMWVPASEHKAEYDDEEEEEDDLHSGVNGETRGRQQETLA